jgi:hypothetical protein
MDYYILTDKQLIKHVLKNDKKAAVFLFQIKCNKLFNYIQYSLFKQNVLETDGLINEFYLYLQQNKWEKLREFQYRVQLTAWLSTVFIRYFWRNYRNFVIAYLAKETLFQKAKSLSIRLHALLSLKIEEFTDMMQRLEFESNLTYCNKMETFKGGFNRPQRYQKLGEEIVKRSKDLLTIWDEKPAKEVGGMPEVIERATKKNLAIFNIKI